MKFLPYLVAAVLLAVALLRRARRGAGSPAGLRRRPRARGDVLARLFGDAGLVAGREIHERMRGRMFRIGTLLVLAVVGVAVGLSGTARHKEPVEKVAVVRASSALVETLVHSGTSVGVRVQVVREADTAAARAAVRSGAVAFALEGPTHLLVNKPLSATDTSAAAQLVRATAASLGVAHAVQGAHLSAAQVLALAHAPPVTVSHLRPGTRPATSGASLLGLPLLLFLFIQYNTWTMIGVMEEKSSRVVEVLIATLRPIQLLSGKVLGIGAVALSQAGLAVAVALLVGRAVGSDVAKGTTTLFLLAVLVWLLLGYAFYSWVYAAAGSLAERQDQVQTIALPLSVPILVAYVVSLVAQASGRPSLLVEVLAYLPPTAPFAVPALVSLGALSWWQFLVSAVLSILGTIVVARVAATIYRRAVLRTGRRVRLREVLGRAAT